MQIENQRVTPASPAPVARSAPYHHGDLPATLRSAAAELLAERGLAGFSLREVARRAGVSHAAPAHHFGDAEGLLTSVAIEAFQYLTAETEAAREGIDDPVEALVQVGRAYVAVSVAHPGHCTLIFREDAVCEDDPDLQEWGLRAYTVLVSSVEQVAKAKAPDLDVEIAAIACWSMVQGLVTLYGSLAAASGKDKSGEAIPPIDDLADSTLRLLIHGLITSAQPRY